MADCTNCKFASWQRTAKGTLHPSGEGRCTWQGWTKWKLPAAFYYTSNRDMRSVPTPRGGQINRRTPIKASECQLFQPAKEVQP